MMTMWTTMMNVFDDDDVDRVNDCDYVSTGTMRNVSYAIDHDIVFDRRPRCYRNCDVDCTTFGPETGCDFSNIHVVDMPEVSAVIWTGSVCHLNASIYPNSV